MNGPQHYAEAERLLDLAARLSSGQRGEFNELVMPTEEGIEKAERLVPIAQAHATLALAAATVGGQEQSSSAHAEFMRTWDEVLAS